MRSIDLILRFTARDDRFNLCCGDRFEKPALSLQSVTGHLGISYDLQLDELRADPHYHLVHPRNLTEDLKLGIAYIPLPEVQPYLERRHRIRDRVGRIKLADYRLHLVAAIQQLLAEERSSQPTVDTPSHLSAQTQNEEPSATSHNDGTHWLPELERLEQINKLLYPDDPQVRLHELRKKFQDAQRQFRQTVSPTSSGATESWWNILGLPKTATLEQVEKRYRELALQHHPDRGGDVRVMQKIIEAYQQAKLAFRR